jgi:hypothetical protein
MPSLQQAILSIEPDLVLAWDTPRTRLQCNWFQGIEGKRALTGFQCAQLSLRPITDNFQSTFQRIVDENFLVYAESVHIRRLSWQATFVSKSCGRQRAFRRGSIGQSLCRDLLTDKSLYLRLNHWKYLKECLIELEAGQKQVPWTCPLVPWLFNEEEELWPHRNGRDGAAARKPKADGWG